MNNNSITLSWTERFGNDIPLNRSITLFDFKVNKVTSSSYMMWWSDIIVNTGIFGTENTKSFCQMIVKYLLDDRSALFRTDYIIDFDENWDLCFKKIKQNIKFVKGLPTFLPAVTNPRYDKQPGVIQASICLFGLEMGVEKTDPDEYDTERGLLGFYRFRKLRHTSQFDQFAKMYLHYDRSYAMFMFDKDVYNSDYQEELQKIACGKDECIFADIPTSMQLIEMTELDDDE